MLTASQPEDLHAPPSARLQLVPISLVLPHEIADPGREARIQSRLAAEGILRDPVMVGAVPDLEPFVLLDGTNRRIALQRLGCHLILAQVLNYADPAAVHLRTWCHSAHLPLNALLDGIHAIPGIEVSPLPPLGAQDALADRSTLAILLGHHRRYVLTRLAGPIPRPIQLRQLVDLYEERMTREDCAEDEVEDTAGHLPEVAAGEAVLVAFPRFSRAQVVQMALQDTPIPAGITRHMIASGRALRVNLPLDLLRSADAEAANDALAEYLATLHPRAYREPTILFDS